MAPLVLALALLASAQATEVCYDDLGCFDDLGVWAGRGLPEAPIELATRFLLYTRNANYEYEIMYDKEAMLGYSDFDASRARTIVLIHGFADSCDEAWPLEMMQALLAEEDANVMCIDWNFGSDVYEKARDNSRLLAAEAERMFNWLGAQTGLLPSQLYLIGHDIGAHAAAYISNRLGGVPRITGLDPAALDFEDADSLVRLDTMDADLVDVILSNAAGYDAFGLGTTALTGHVSFYPNGGVHQTGCEDTIHSYIRHLSGLRTLKISRSEWLSAACSHFRSTAFFTESISSSCGFLAVPCSSWDALVSGTCPSRCHSGECRNMGFHADRHTANSGSFYLFTEPSSPYCEAFMSLEVVIGYGQESTEGKLTAKVLGPEAQTFTLQDGPIAKSDVFHDSFSGSDPGSGDLLVELTYTRASSTIFHHYSTSLEVSTTALQLNNVEVSVSDGDMRLRTYWIGSTVLETGVPKTVVVPPF